MANRVGTAMIQDVSSAKTDFGSTRPLATLPGNPDGFASFSVAFISCLRENR